MTALTGTFWSPNYPLDYKNHASCKWHITVPSNYIISVSFEDVTLERTCCRCDYVEVWETLKNGSAVLIATFCDGTKPDPTQQFRSAGNDVTIVFRSDATVQERGFKASYRAIPMPGKKVNFTFHIQIWAFLPRGLIPSACSVLHDLLYHFHFKQADTFKWVNVAMITERAFYSVVIRLSISLAETPWPDRKRGELQIDKTEMGALRRVLGQDTLLLK